MFNSAEATRQTPPVQADELEALKAENQRLKSIVSALMYGYSSICEANLRTQAVSFFQLGIFSLSSLGLSDHLPSWDELVTLYVRYGVFEEDRPVVHALLDRQYLAEHLQCGGGMVREYRNVHGVYGEAKVVRIDEDTVIVGFSEKNREITERNSKIYTDSLTQLNNRKYYDSHLAPLSCQALVMADIDHFKAINDTNGHLCGDVALAATAAVLQSSVREKDDVVRYGGDEFLIAFQSITPESLQERMERIRRAVEELRLDDYPQVRLSMSFGVTYGGGRISDMISTADKLLYESKQKRNTVTIRPFPC
ncbi:MAG: GGDEF domain-containing protein [Ruminococcaceae bacterium]|nr:GGDEF domain-containing protein [Oscillospiraceae bacterium]